MTPPVLIIVQARMASTRFPGKVLAPLLGQPMLLWQLDRLSRVQTPHTLVVGTSAAPENAPLVELCQRHGYRIQASTGIAEDDVLGRFHTIAEAYPEAQEIVRVTGDCPLIDPVIVDALIAQHRGHNMTDALQRDGYWHTPIDHTGIAAEWPDGQDCEIFSRTALDLADVEATASHDREHVTPWIWSQPEMFRCKTLPCPLDLSWMQTSVDTQDDLTMVQHLLDWILTDVGFSFGWRDIWRYIVKSPMLRVWQQRRPPRNQAYVTQVGSGKTWEELRYRTRRTPSAFKAGIEGA